MKYKMVFKTEPSKHTYTQEEKDQKLDRIIDKMLDELILNGHLKIGE
jgi:hypothetical protein